LGRAQRVRRLVAVALVFGVGAARAQGFLADFYSQAGDLQHNVTQAGVYQGAALNTITGGGFVFKAPQKTFMPYYVTPPSLRYGCGGIDVFLGAFSLPSRAEFVAFLRNIGQNLPGLAFQLALQSLSAELAQQVADFRKLIMDATAKGIDACQAATTLVDNAGKFMFGVGLKTKNEMRATGVCSDEADCTEKTKADFGTVLANCRAVTDSEGNIEEACQMNVVWALLRSAQMDEPSVQDRWRELVMSALGTRIHRANGTGPDAVVSAVDKEKLIEADDFIGSVDSPTINVKYYACDEPTYCLDPRPQYYAERGLARWIYDVVTRYKKAILDRDPSVVALNEMQMIASATSVPLLRIVNAVAYSKTPALADDVIRVYSEAAAYELAMQFFDQLLAQAEKASKVKQTNAQMAYVADYAKTLEERIRDARTRVREQGKALSERMARVGAFVSVVEHFDRAMKTNMAAELAANLRFGQR
jgi:conjugative transfer pilus assembly protein TraH